MGRFGALKLRFYDADDLETPLEDSSENHFLYAVRGRYLEGTSEAGWTEVVIPMTPDWDELVEYNRICVPYYPDSIWQAATSDPLGQNFGTGFRIQEVEPFNGDGGAMVRIAGPEETNDLKFGQPIFRPIGEEVVNETTIVGAKTFELVTTLAAGAPNGNNSCTVTSASGVNNGDTIYIAMDGAAGIHVATLDEAPSGTSIHFVPSLPEDAASGNWVQFRRFAAPGLTPFSTTLAIGAPNNNDSCTVASIAGVQSGDEIRITMDSSMGTHIAEVKHLEGDLGTNRMTFTPRIPFDASAGNAVQFRRRKIFVAGEKEALAEGVEVHVIPDSLSTHFTRAAEDPQEDGDGISVVLEKGIPSATSAGQAVNIYNYSNPATDDIDQIMFYRPDWTVNYDGAYEGTADGTFRAPIGDSVYDLLQAAAASSGEYWRQTLSSEAGYMVRELDWKRTHDYAGYGDNLRLVMPSQADITTHSADINRAIITGRLSHKVSGEILTRCYPIAGDDRVSIALATDEGIDYATANGFTIVIPDPDTNLYGYPYIYNATLEADDTIGVRSRTVNFSTVRANIPKIPELQAAADDLVKQAVNWLLERQSFRTFYELDGVVSAVPIRAGDRVEIYYEDPSGDWTIFRTGGNALYVLEAIRDYDVNDTDTRPEGTSGVPLYTLKLATEPWAEPTVQSTEASILRDAEKMVRTGGGAPSQLSISIGSVNSGGGGGGATDHGALTGLGDDDHGQYWNTTRGNAAIATHTADADAHHALVTAGNTAIGVSGQAVSVALASSPGLEVSSGLKVLLNPSEPGLQLTSGLKVLLASNPGLELSSGLKMLAPQTLSATSTNTLVGGVSHAITTTYNSITDDGEILRTRTDVGYEGSLSLAMLTVGAAVDNTATLKAVSINTDDYTLYLKQKSGQTADIWRVENSSSTPLVRLTGSGNLESGNPAFVSGLTGWRIEGATGNAEFNDIVARGEFHASVFVADELHATGGTLAVLTATKVVAGSGNNTIPGSVGSTFTLNIQAQHTDPGASYFANNDVLRLKWIRTNIGGDVMDGRDLYLQVTSVPGSPTGRDESENEPGYFPTTVRWLYGAEAGYVIPTGTAVVKWGEISGSGFTGGIILTSDLTYAPYIDIFTVDATQNATTWQSGPVTPIPRVRIGNLRGVLGNSSDKWGVAMGNNLSDATTAAKYITANATDGVVLQNVDVSLYNSGTKTVEIGNTGDVKFGTAVSSDSTTTFRHVASTGAVRLGSIGSGKGNAYWDGTDFHIRMNTTPVITLDNGGNSYFSGVMTIGTSGEIRQGTGTAGTVGVWNDPTWGSFTGWRIGRSSSVGRISTYNGGTPQIEFDSNGRLKAGGGIVTLDSNGLKIQADEDWTGDPQYEFRFVTDSGDTSASMDAKVDTSSYQSHVRLVVKDPYIGFAERAGIYLTTTDPSNNGNRASYAVLNVEGGGSFGLYYTESGSATYAVVDADYIRTYGELRVDEGISVGTYFAANQGQIVSDLAGDNWNSIVLTDTTDVAHGMTSVVNTSSYGTLGKHADTTGGLWVAGYGEGAVGIGVAGYATSTSTTEATSSSAAIQLNAYLKSGTGTTTFANDDNLLVVRNTSNAQFIVKGNGDFYYNGTGAAYDDEDDLALMHAVELARQNKLDAAWAERLQYDRADLQRLGLVTFNEDGGHFVNGARMQYLAYGAMRQMAADVRGMAERIRQLEEQLA